MSLRIFTRSLVIVLACLFPFAAMAAITFNPDESGNIIANPGLPANGYPTKVLVTFYGPGASGSMEGPFATSQSDLTGSKIPHTLDDVRLGRSQYVTLASDPSNYQKWYQIPSITYRSPLDQRFYTLTNVVGLVHDTGSAFQGHPEKMDIAVGNFTGQSQQQTAAVIYGDSASPTWLQVGGVVGGTTVTAGRTYYASPFSVASPVSIGGGQVLAQDYYCITNLEPIIVVNVPAGTPFPSNCYNQPPAGTQTANASPFSSAPPASPTTNPSSGAASNQPGTTSGQNTVPPPASLIIVQPQRVPLGGTAVVSWTSVGMRSTQSCEVTAQSGSIPSVLAQTSEGTKVVQVTQGDVTFTLSCNALNGSRQTQSVTVHMQ